MIKSPTLTQTWKGLLSAPPIDSVPSSSIAHSKDQSNWIKLKWLEASLQLAASDMGFKVKSKG